MTPQRQQFNLIGKSIAIALSLSIVMVGCCASVVPTTPLMKIEPLEKLMLGTITVVPVQDFEKKTRKGKIQFERSLSNAGKFSRCFG